MEAANMALKEQIEHAAAVTKWKADQQMRILKIQGQINDMESTIKGRVYALGETTLRLSEQGELQQPSLLELTHQIAALKEQLLGLQQSLTAVKTESGPQRAQAPQAFSGLVCPECGAMLRGNFCPEHGVAGVPPTAPEPAPTVSFPGGYLACPVCNQRLNGKFCPAHGIEGIWVQPSQPAYSSPEPRSDPKPETPPVNPSPEFKAESWSSYTPVTPENPQPDRTDTFDHDDL
jgi:hypothetical protein